MLKIQSINNCYENLNYLKEKQYISDSDLEYNSIINQNYYRDLGYYYEKLTFINLVHNTDYNDIFKDININYNFYKGIKYFNKFYINNPNNDFFLKNTCVTKSSDISLNKICDLNITSLIKSKDHIKFFCILEFIRNFYYFITTDDYYNKYANDYYYFKIPIKYFISNKNNIISQNFNSYLEFKAYENNDNINIIYLNTEKTTFTNNFLEFIKPIIIYHVYLVNKDIKLSNKINKYNYNQNFRDIADSYANTISKFYDIYRFQSIRKITDSLKFRNNPHYNNWKTDYFQFIRNNYNFYIVLDTNRNINLIDITNCEQYDYTLNTNDNEDDSDTYNQISNSPLIDNYSTLFNNNFSNISLSADDIYDELDDINNDENNNYLLYTFIFFTLFIFITLAFYINIKIVDNNIIDIQIGGSNINYNIFIFIFVIIIIIILYNYLIFYYNNYYEKFNDFASILGSIRGDQDFYDRNMVSDLNLNVWDSMLQNISEDEAENMGIDIDTISQNQNNDDGTTNYDQLIQDIRSKGDTAISDLTVAEQNENEQEIIRENAYEELNENQTSIESNELEIGLVEEQLTNSNSELNEITDVINQEYSIFELENQKLEDMIKQRIDDDRNFNTAIESANLASKSAEEALNIIKENEKIENDTKVNKLLNIDLDNLDFNTFDFGNFGNELKKTNYLDEIDLSKYDSEDSNFVENKSNAENAIDKAIDDKSISITKKDLLTNEKIKLLLANLDLEDKISLEKGLIDAGIQAKQFAEITKEELRLISATTEVKDLLKKVKDSTHSASLARILASIEQAKKEIDEKKIEEQKLKVKMKQNSLEFKKVLSSETSKRILAEKNLIKSLENTIDTSITKKKKIESDIQIIDDELAKKKERTLNAQNFVKTTLNKLYELEKELISKEITENEARERKEILDLLKLSIYSREEIEKKLTLKYKNLKKQYELQNLILKLEYDITENSNKLKKLYTNQGLQLKKIEKSKKKLNIITSKSKSLKSNLDTLEKKFKTEKIIWDKAIKISDKNIIDITKDISTLIVDNDKLEKLIETTLSKKRLNEIDLNKLINQKNFENKVEIIKTKEIEIQKINIILNQYNKNKQHNNTKLKKKRDQIEIEETEKYNLITKYKYTQSLIKENININNNKYETNLLNENIKLKENIYNVYNLFKISIDIIKIKKEILFYNEKKETLIQENINNSKLLHNNILIELKDSTKILLETKKIEFKLKTTLKLAQNNYDKKLKEREKLIYDTNKELVQEKNITIIENIQSKLNTLKQPSTMETISLQKVSAAKYAYNEILHKRILLQFSEIKLTLDKCVTDLIKNCKEVIKFNQLIIIDSNKNDIYAFTLKSQKLYLNIMNDEIFRLKNIETQAYNELENKKILIQKYNNILIKDSTNTDIKDLYTKEIDNQKSIELDLKNISDKITTISNKIDKKSKEFDNSTNNFVNIVEKTKYNIKQNKDKKIKLVDNIIQFLKIYQENTTNYLDSRKKIIEAKINFPKFALNPLPISKYYKDFILSLLNDNDLKLKQYLKENDFVNDVSKLINDITTITKIDKLVINDDITIKIIINNNQKINENIEKKEFIQNFINEFSESLEIDTQYINIDILNILDKNIIIKLTIFKNSKYDNSAIFIEELIKQHLDTNSKLNKGLYGKNITDITDLYYEKENSEPEKSTDMIHISSYISKIFDKNLDINLDKFDFLTTNQNDNLLLYLKFISNNNTTKYTFKDYSIYNKHLTNVLLDDSKIKPYEKYIALDKNLLKVNNINFNKYNEFTISFVSKLSPSNKTQNILLSNGTISQLLRPNAINSDTLSTSNHFHDNNIFTLGFINNSFYLRLPCKNNKIFYNIGGSNSTLKLKSKDNEWNHWIITKKNNIINIYKNFENIIVDYKIDNYNDLDSSCYTDNPDFDTDKLYIGGLKTDRDDITQQLNNIVGFTGGLKDLRIYNKIITHNDFKSLFIFNDKIENISIRPEPTFIKNHNQPDIIRIDSTLKDLKTQKTIEKNTQKTITYNNYQNYNKNENFYVYNIDNSKFENFDTTKENIYDNDTCFTNFIPISKNNQLYCYNNNFNNDSKFITEIDNTKFDNYLDKFNIDKSCQNKNNIYNENTNSWQCNNTNDPKCFNKITVKNNDNDYYCLSNFDNNIDNIKNNMIVDKNLYHKALAKNNIFDNPTKLFSCNHIYNQDNDLWECATENDNNNITKLGTHYYSNHENYNKINLALNTDNDSDIYNVHKNNYIFTKKNNDIKILYPNKLAPIFDKELSIDYANFTSENKKYIIPTTSISIKKDNSKKTIVPMPHISDSKKIDFTGNMDLDFKNIESSLQKDLNILTT